MSVGTVGVLGPRHALDRVAAEIGFRVVEVTSERFDNAAGRTVLYVRVEATEEQWQRWAEQSQQRKKPRGGDLV